METVRRLPDPDLTVKFYRGAWRWFCRTATERGGFFNIQLMPHAHSEPEGHYSASEAYDAAVEHWRDCHVPQTGAWDPPLRVQRYWTKTAKPKTKTKTKTGA